MAKALAPIVENWAVRVLLIDSMAVNIPTRAIIPNAMINIVSIALRELAFIDLTAIRTFSLRIPKFIWLVFLFSYQMYKKSQHLRFIFL
jgi:hypothetical protein